MDLLSNTALALLNKYIERNVKIGNIELYRKT